MTAKIINEGKNIMCFSTQINACNFCTNNKDKANNAPKPERVQTQHKSGHRNLGF